MKVWHLSVAPKTLEVGVVIRLVDPKLCKNHWILVKVRHPPPPPPPPPHLCSVSTGQLAGLVAGLLNTKADISAAAGLTEK